MIDKEKLLTRAQKIDIELSGAQLDMFDRFANMLVDANKTTNLTRIESPDDILEKHFIDCLYAAKFIKDGCKVIDIGSGAGFPSVVIAISKNVDITMLDSVGKKLEFVDYACNQLGIAHNIINSRAETVARDVAHREMYDYVTARAVARLNKLCEYCMGFVRVGGSLLAMKGSDGEVELQEADSAVRTLGGKFNDICKYDLCDGSNHCIIEIKKLAKLDDKYPRTAKKIDKLPL